MFSYQAILCAIALLTLNTSLFAGVIQLAPKISPATKTVAVKQTTSSEKVNINKATLEDLLKVKGMTQPKAKSILAYRKKEGDFKSLDVLPEVKGFKRMKKENREAITDQLTI